MHIQLIENNYQEDSIFLAHSSLADADAVVKTIDKLKVSTVVYESTVSSVILKYISKELPHIFLVRQGKINVTVDIKGTFTHKNPYLITQPVIDCTGNILREATIKKLEGEDTDEYYNEYLKVSEQNIASRITFKNQNVTRPVLKFMENVHFPIKYCEFCTDVGSTFNAVVSMAPYASQFYAFDFRNKVENFPNLFNSPNIHRNSFNKLSNADEIFAPVKDIHFDVSFYDESHSHTDSTRLEWLAAHSDVVIVHDCNWYCVEILCDRVFKGADYYTRQDGATVTRFYVLNNKERYSFVNQIATECKGVKGE